MKRLHCWKVTPEEAIRIQENLRQRIILRKMPYPIRTIGGADASYQKESNLLFGAMVVLSFPQMETLEVATARGRVSFPYLPGLLAFREGPILIKAYQKLCLKPDLLIFDGQGIAHPRGMGLASHLGIWFQVPSIGCAKTSLLSESIHPDSSKGSYEVVQKDGRAVGAILRTREGVRPVFVSPGHRIDLQTSIELVLATCLGFRIPEPLRRAHHFSRLLLKSA